MARPKEVIDAELAKKARLEILKCREHKVGLRLQAIVSCAENPVSLVGEVVGVSRQTVWRWMKRFKAEGAVGIYDKPRGHNPVKIGEENRRIIEGWLKGRCNNRGEPVQWTLAKLAAEIKQELGITVGQTSLWRLVRQMGFRQKVPRPSHAKADSRTQQAFKKNL